MNEQNNKTIEEKEQENELSPDEKNKAQPTVAVDKAGGAANMGTGYRDKERVNERANEAPDSTDSNTGGIIAGGAKGASQS